MEHQVYLTNIASHDRDEFALSIKGKLNSSFKNRVNKQAQVNHLIDQIQPQFYYERKRLKPGFHIYKTINEVEERRNSGDYQGPFLSLRIPDSVLSVQNSSCLIYHANGIVKIESFVTHQTFLQRMNVSQNESPVFPCVVSSSSLGIDYTHSILMSDEVSLMKSLPRSSNVLFRQYLKPYAQTPNIFRLFFFNKQINPQKQNYAYKAVGLKKMNTQLFSKQQRLSHHYLIDPKKQQLYNLTLIKGKALEQSNKMAQSLLNYLEKAANVRINDMVIDFIVNQKKQCYFFDLVAVSNTNLTNLWDIGSIEVIKTIAQSNNNFLTCPLCYLKYPQPKMTKIVTNKLIIELVNHSKSRRYPLKCERSFKNQGFSNVCNLCYDVIVAEHKLIDVQKEFAYLLNLSKSLSNELQTVSNERFSKNNQFSSELQQASLKDNGNSFKTWRLFFYFERVKDCKNAFEANKINIKLKMMFKNLKSKFSKCLYRQSFDQSNIQKSITPSYNQRHTHLNSQLTSQVKNSSVSFTRITNCTASRQNSRASIKQQSRAMHSKTISSMDDFEKHILPLQKIKVLVFYTRQNHVGNMLNGTCLDFQLSVNENKFEGTSSTLQKLRNREPCQRHSSEVLLFDQKLRYCSLQFTVGLICDGQSSGQGLELYEKDGLFFSLKPQSSCRPLPVEWMQVFTQGQEIQQYTRGLKSENQKTQQRKQAVLVEDL